MVFDLFESLLFRTRDQLVGVRDQFADRHHQHPIVSLPELLLLHVLFCVRYLYIGYKEPLSLRAFWTVCMLRDQFV